MKCERILVYGNFLNNAEAISYVTAVFI